MLKAFLSASCGTRIHAHSFGAVGCLAIACCFLMGCSPAARPVAQSTTPADDHADHDHADDHDHPKTLAAGITQLETLCGDVKAAMAEKDLKKADPVLHEIGHLLEDIQSLLKAAKLPAEVNDSANQAIDEIFECFDKIDITLHESEGAKHDSAKESDGATYDELADRIAVALGTLKKVSP